jgi:hypothetical protein
MAVRRITQWNESADTILATAKNKLNNVERKTDMKTNIIKTYLIACASLALVFTVNAAEPMKPMKGGEHLMMLNKVETKGDADALKVDDSIAMVCAKCKTVYVTRVRQGVKGAELLMSKGQPMELIGSHACPGCNSTVTVTGHGKGKEAVLKHSCGACGDNSAFCCSTKPGGASKGMEKDAKK